MLGYDHPAVSFSKPGFRGPMSVRGSSQSRAAQWHGVNDVQ
jgi:hypothetical protein